MSALEMEDRTMSQGMQVPQKVEKGKKADSPRYLRRNMMISDLQNSEK